MTFSGIRKRILTRLSAKREGGYLLLELVIAAAVFLLVLAPLLQLGARLSHQQTRIGLQRQAVELAALEMEQLLADVDNPARLGRRQDTLGSLPCEVEISRQPGDDYDEVLVVVKYQSGDDKYDQVAFTRSVEKE